MKFVKLTATGNDFIFFDSRPTKFNEDLALLTGCPSRAEQAIQLCDRHFGIGADGLVFLQQQGDGEFSWDFYNRDGSNAEMCGNAARGFALFAQTLGLGQQIEFNTRAGRIRARVLKPGWVEVNMTQPRVIAREHEFTSLLKGELIDSGVPHVVIEVSSLQDRAELLKMVAVLRHHALTGPGGANVTFFERMADREIASVTFERGVEDFTLACGTGAVAAALSSALKTSLGQILVTLPGGQVEVQLTQDQTLLSGPAQIVFTGELK